MFLGTCIDAIEFLSSMNAFENNTIFPVQKIHRNANVWRNSGGENSNSFAVVQAIIFATTSVHFISSHLYRVKLSIMFIQGVSKSLTMFD